ncbi:hypothetical protein CLIB1444_16S01442 [[Candida] jaroonii]|uniref:Uncharacterized protein n=1 Tax=[Candida] jaroonii TaxID=467808 RepID=A0ACA9YF88_9ASCO|nr:hypothetical protein CLIB1444_16S01442 [[Candida] jaroonii]
MIRVAPRFKARIPINLIKNHPSSSLRGTYSLETSHHAIKHENSSTNPSKNGRQIPIHIVKFSDNSFNPKNQQKVVNLGKVTDQLQDLIPNILNKSLPKSIISSDIMLRFIPTHVNESYLPSIRGHVSYYASFKAIQILTTAFILNPQVKLHIQSIKVIEEESNIDVLCVYKKSTKIHVRWTTCNEGCYHLNDSKSTSDAKLGSHTWSKVDTSRVNLDDTFSLRNISKLSLGLVGLNKNQKQLERVVSGIFIFELNEENDKIIVHTIDDVNIIENESEEVGDLKVC